MALTAGLRNFDRKVPSLPLVFGLASGLGAFWLWIYVYCDLAASGFTSESPWSVGEDARDDCVLGCSIIFGSWERTGRGEIPGEMFQGG